MAFPASVGADRGSAADPLAEKASIFRRQMLARHVPKEGVVLYRVDLRTIQEDLERGTYPYLADTPTFTGIWAATACTRAELEADPTQALHDADQALTGLESLMAVTGVPGLMARGIRRDAGRDVSGLRGTWFPGGLGWEAYVWKGDVSMDQYANGLLPAVAECAQRFPDRMRALITQVARHLVENDLQLIDPDGRRTRFGDLSPRSGFGLNSIAQLTAYAAFVWAAELDPEGSWAEHRDRLRDRARVVARGRRTNLRVLGIINHSNDLMAFGLYRALVPLAERQRDPAYADLRHGLARATLLVRDDGNAYLDALGCVLEPATCDRGVLERARSFLERFPLEKRRVAPPAELAAIPRRWIPGRKLKSLARDLVPIELRPPSTFEWKSSPYRLDGTTEPHVQMTGLDFLAAYWALRRAEALVPTGAARFEAGQQGPPLAGARRP